MNRRLGIAGNFMIEVVVAAGLAAMLGAYMTGTAVNALRQAKRIEGRMSAVELRDFLKRNMNCEQTMKTYVNRQGEFTPCVQAGDVAVVKNARGDTLILGAEPVQAREFSVRALCLAPDYFRIEYLDEKDKERGWVPLFKESDSPCKMRAVAAAVAVPTPTPAPAFSAYLSPMRPKDSRHVSKSGTLKNTNALCAGSSGGTPQTLYAGTVNCPGTHRVYNTYLNCGGGRIKEVKLAASGLYAECCGGAANLAIDCSNDYSVRPQYSPRPPRERKDPDFPYTYDYMYNYGESCYGPDPEIRYNNFSGSVSCAKGYLRSLAVRCPSDTRLKGLGAGASDANAECCSASGKIELTCIEPS